MSLKPTVPKHAISLRLRIVLGPMLLLASMGCATPGAGVDDVTGVDDAAGVDDMTTACAEGSGEVAKGPEPPDIPFDDAQAFALAEAGPGEEWTAFERDVPTDPEYVMCVTQTGVVVKQQPWECEYRDGSTYTGGRIYSYSMMVVELETGQIVDSLELDVPGMFIGLECPPFVDDLEDGDDHRRPTVLSVHRAYAADRV